MKKVAIIVFLFIGFSGFSQNLVKNDSIVFKKPTFQFLNIQPKFSFNRLDFYNQYDLSIYNPTTGFNDNFMLYNGKAEYKNSLMIDQNLMFNNKIDSFNPNGSTEMGSALISGGLNMLLDFIQK